MTCCRRPSRRSFAAIRRSSPIPGSKPPYGYVDWWPIQLVCQQRCGAVRRQGRALGAEPLHRPRPGGRGRVPRRVAGIGAADAALQAAAALFRRGEGPADRSTTRWNSIPKKGDALLRAKGFKKQGGKWVGAGREAPGRADHQHRHVRGGPRTSGVGDAEAPRRRRQLWLCRPTSTTASRRATLSGRSTDMAEASASRTTRCASIRARASRSPAGIWSTSRHWKNPEFDKIVDEVYVTDPDNVARLKELFRAAMEIWLPDLPDIQLVQNSSPHSDEHHVLEELADAGQSLHQRRILAPDLPVGAVEPATRVAGTTDAPILHREAVRRLPDHRLARRRR